MNEVKKEKKVVYLAGAYEKLPKEMALELHRNSARVLLQEGLSVISPIMHTEGILKNLNDTAYGDFWEVLEEKFISVSDAVCVIITAQAFISKGVNREVNLAIKHSKPVFYILPEQEQYSILTHMNFLPEIFELNKKEVEEECSQENSSEEKLNQQEAETSTYLGRLLDKLRTEQE